MRLSSFPSLPLLASVMLLLMLSCTSSFEIVQEQELAYRRTQAVDMAEFLRLQPNLMVSKEAGTVNLHIRCAHAQVNGQEPLILVDGYRMGVGYGKVAHLDPREVDRIQVITDPYELPSYGFAALSGVVEIYLKR